VLRRIEVAGVSGLSPLELEVGALTALIGPRGSGKSQLLASIAWLAGVESAPGGEQVSVSAELSTAAGSIQSIRRSMGQPTEPIGDLAAFPATSFLRVQERVVSSQAPTGGSVAQALAERLNRHMTTDAAAAEALVGAIEDCCAGGVGGELLLIEEPELMLTPQAQRHLANLLRMLAESGNQVIYSTRSPAFVDATHAEEIVRLDLHASGSIARRTTPRSLTDEQRLRLAAEFDHERSEMFFARGVILAEGRTERFALPLIFRVLGHDLDAEGIAMVEVGGKANLPLVAGVLNDLRIPCLVVHDTDRGHDPGLDAAIEAAVGADRIIRLDPDFEAVTGIRHGDDKVLAAWRRFSRATPRDVPPPLRRMVELAVALLPPAGG